MSTWVTREPTKTVSGVSRGASSPHRLSSPPRQILVGLLCPIGDTLFATPALAALRHRFPRAHITALVSPSNTGILDGNPSIDARILTRAGREDSGLLSLARNLSAIKRSQYDLMVNFSPAASFIGYLARVPDQVHLHMPRHWWLIGGHSRAYRRQHATDHYLRLIRPLLQEDVPPEERHPRVYVAAAQRAAARQLLRECDIPAATPLVTMHVGGDGFRGRKRWSTARFAAVANQLVEQFGLRVLLIGGPDDRELADEVAALMPQGATNVTGRTTLLETAALIERSTLFIGNDSCPLHIAAAVSTPSVGIFGPSSVQQFRPLGAPGYRQRVLTAQLPCSPCFHFVGTDAPWVPNLCYSYACLKAISADAVIDAATSLLTADRTMDTPSERHVHQRPGPWPPAIHTQHAAAHRRASPLPLTTS